MNVYDSGRIGNILQTLGYIETQDPTDADLIIFNTCHIREKAAEKVFSDLGRIYLIKQAREKKGLDTIIGVTGCVVQAEDKQIAKRAPFVDFATGPLTYHRLPEILARIGREKGVTIIDTEFTTESKFDLLPKNEAQSATSYLAIQEGCNNFCTYCVVPYTRGVETSRPIKSIIEEAKRLIGSGSLEITLIGQNVNSFHGEDESGKERNLAYLLREVAELDGIKRIRYTTSYPADVNDDLIQCHKDLKLLMPFLHLPIQSGSDRILKAMNRKHTIKDYLNIVEKITKADPNIGMSSDFIVGFPGEDDEDFKATLALVDEVKFVQAFSYKYSPRAGTPAAVMTNQVEEKVKKERLETLQNLIFSYQTQFNKSCIGKTVPVLFDMQGRYNGQLVGRTPYMQTLHAKLGQEFLNKIVDVEVTKATTNSLTGVVKG